MDVRERFLRYVAFSTPSDEASQSVPSTQEQRELGAYLAEELRQLGLIQVVQDENGYVYGLLPGSRGCEGLEAIGFIAHMDTSPSVSGREIRPRILRYAGGDIDLGNGVRIDEESYPCLARYVGQELIVTDGTTLLGADDKAGIAEIVTACAYLATHLEVPHRPVAVCFTPDEEIGRGADHFDFGKFFAPKAYTVDGGELGEIEYENFNAASATVEIRGINIHPGSAKGKMKNAALLASELIGRLPPAEAPAHTEGYEGFYHVCEVRADESKGTVQLIVRDHDQEKFEARKDFLRTLTDYLNTVYGQGTFTLTLKDSYYNMKEKLLPHMDLIRRAGDAMRAAGAEPVIRPIRGGTDGARLSYEGLPCPNLSTGGVNFHSVREFIPVESMERMVQVLLYLASPAE